MRVVTVLQLGKSCNQRLLAAHSQHMGTGGAPKGKREKFTAATLPNIRTNPAKRGGFGVANTTIGPHPSYESEPYDLAREEEQVRFDM